MHGTTMKTACLEIINKCNLKCIHCYLDGVFSKSSMISLEFIEKFIDVMNDDLLGINITGGEPMLHPLFNEIYKRIRSKGLITNILTNGTLLKQETLTLFNHQLPHRIEISLYGMSEESYFLITGKRGLFKVVLKNIELLKNLKANLLIKYNILNQNSHELKEFIIFCNSQNLDFSISSQIVPRLNKKEDNLQHRVSGTNVKQILAENKLTMETTNVAPHICDAGDNFYIDSSM